MKDSFQMQSHKLFWHLNRVEKWDKGERIAPLYIDMGITQSCNMACKYCYYATPSNHTNNNIPTDKLIEFLNDCAEIGVKAIGFLGDGEPMIHLGVYEAVIAGKNVGLDMAISTNGLIMKDQMLPQFLESLTWIRFNLSAADQNAFEKIMGNPKKNFEKVINNIKKCVAIKKKKNIPITIGMQMVLIPDCVDQIVKYAKLGRDLGLDYVVVKQCSESAGIKQEEIIRDYQKLESIMKEAESYSSSEYQVIIKRKKMHYDKKKYDKCYGCEFLPQISGAGDVYPCGNFFGKKEFLIGNVVNQSFRDIVFGEKYNDIMTKIKAKVNVHSDCGFKCRQNEINGFLWELKNKPNHVNFI